MPTIPSGTKFMGVNPDVNTDERRSALSNSYQEFYTIDEIVAEASAADTNIYNSDGTLDANRTVDLDGNTLNLSGGNVGIGTTNPSTPLQVRSTAIPSAGEAIARFDVSDSSAYLQVANGTSTNSAFAPVVQGRQVGTSAQSALQTEGIIDSVDDTGTTPVTIFKARLATLAQVVTRPVFQFSNWTSNIMTMLANGNVGIGTTTPTEKLEVSGKTKTTTFQMTTTPTAGYVLTSDASGNGSWQLAGSSSGKFGISDSTGAYTYYSSLSSAITAASSGQVIELFADITESSSTAVNLKAGVIIQGNGHTYTHTSTTGNTFVCPTTGTYQFMNLNINRTVTTPTGAAIFAGKSGEYYYTYTMVFNSTTVQYNYTSSVGATVFFDPISVHSFVIDGLRAIANGSGTMIPSSARVTNIRNSYLENTGTGSGFSSENFSPSFASLENCYIKTNSGTSFVLSYSAQARNCTGISESGKAFEGGFVYDCYGFSNTYRAFDSVTTYNCTANTSTGVCFYAGGAGSGAFNSTGQSTTGYVVRPYFYSAKYFNCSLYSSGSIVGYDYDWGASFYNCSIISDYDNASGHAISFGPSSGNQQFINNYIQVKNASANCIKGSQAITAKYTNNNFSGATTSVNANVTQGTSNSEDSQGNITI